MKKDSNLLIRVSELEKTGFERAADISGVGVSTWARQVLRAAAVKDLQGVGETPAFLAPTAPKKSTKKK